MLKTEELPTLFRNHARALMLSLGKDPNPSNLSKIGVSRNEKYGLVYSVERMDYLVFHESELDNFLIELLLTNPLSLPADILALFISYSIDRTLGFETPLQIAENFKSLPTDQNVWIIRRIIENDVYLGDHMREGLVNHFGSLSDAISGIGDVYGFTVKYQIYRDSSYWIFGYKPEVGGCKC